MFDVTFNNISVISWRSVLLVEESGVPGKNYRPAASHWQTLWHNIVSSIPRLSWIRLTTLVVIGTECICSCRSNYHTITTMMAPVTRVIGLSWYIYSGLGKLDNVDSFSVSSVGICHVLARCFAMRYYCTFGIGMQSCLGIIRIHVMSWMHKTVLAFSSHGFLPILHKLSMSWMSKVARFTRGMLGQPNVMMMKNWQRYRITFHWLNYSKDSILHNASLLYSLNYSSGRHTRYWFFDTWFFFCNCTMASKW